MILNGDSNDASSSSQCCPATCVAPGLAVGLRARSLDEQRLEVTRCRRAELCSFCCLRQHQEVNCRSSQPAALEGCGVVACAPTQSFPCLVLVCVCACTKQPPRCRIPCLKFSPSPPKVEATRLRMKGMSGAQGSWLVNCWARCAVKAQKGKQGSNNNKNDPKAPRGLPQPPGPRFRSS